MGAKNIMQNVSRHPPAVRSIYLSLHSCSCDALRCACSASTGMSDAMLFT